MYFLNKKTLTNILMEIPSGCTLYILSFMQIDNIACWFDNTAMNIYRWLRIFMVMRVYKWIKYSLELVKYIECDYVVVNLLIQHNYKDIWAVAVIFALICLLTPFPYTTIQAQVHI